MDYKLEYMERLFAKISKKKTESYVISRIWHQLDDDRVKFVVQQYIRRTQDRSTRQAHLCGERLSYKLNRRILESDKKRHKRHLSSCKSEALAEVLQGVRFPLQHTETD